MLRNVNFKFNRECSQKLMVLNLQSYHFNLLCGIFCERDAYEGYFLYQSLKILFSEI